MKTLSATLLDAQQSETFTPYVRLEARKRLDGAIRLDFTRLYTGTEADYLHAVTIAGDGSLIRVRITPASDACKLYYQRVASPGAASDFSQWTYASQYNTVVVSAASLGAEVSIFWIRSDLRIQRIKSINNGVSWGSTELIDYSASSAINGISAAYKPNGDMALFFADQSTLYVKKYVGGAWQARTAWGKSTGDLSGVSVIYDGDWNLFVTGKDTAGNFKLWSLVYGDGTLLAAGTWSDLKEIATAPAGSGYSYKYCFLDKVDIVRCYYVEAFSGTQTYSRPFWTHPVNDAAFDDNLWREPVPFNLTSTYGLAITHDADYTWLSCANGVWRAPLDEDTLDLSSDIESVKQEAEVTGGKITVELRNDMGAYNSLPSPLEIGCELTLSFGYLTSAGSETGTGQSYKLEDYEHISSSAGSNLMLSADDGWTSLHRWIARQQFRWNKAGNEKSVKDMLALVLARSGLSLEVITESATISSFYPDFTINPGDRGDNVVKTLLSFVSDVVFMEGNKAYLANPQANDSSIYSYGTVHMIRGARFGQKMGDANRILVEGLNVGTGNPIVVDNFNWEGIERCGDNLLRIEDGNIGTEALGEGRGEAVLDKLRLSSASGFILVTPNCGQQICDVIDVTDARLGLTSNLRRVVGLNLTYEPMKAIYEQKLMLGGV
jgi:hypothetical protein